MLTRLTSLACESSKRSSRRSDLNEIEPNEVRVVEILARHRSARTVSLFTNLLAALPYRLATFPSLCEFRGSYGNKSDHRSTIRTRSPLSWIRDWVMESACPSQE